MAADIPMSHRFVSREITGGVEPGNGSHGVELVVIRSDSRMDYVPFTFR